MQIFYYEPNADIRQITTSEMQSAGIKASEIFEDFFENDLSILTRDGSKHIGILISHSSRTTEFIKAIRAAGCKNPIIVMRDGKNSFDVAAHLNQGADDSMVRPFKGVEVMARFNAITRRSHGHASESVKIGEIEAFFDGRDPLINGQRMKLSQREHAIFSHLALNEGRVISKDSLYDAVYGMSDNQPFDKVIDVYICKLRAKIQLVSDQKYIETVYGRGYKLAEPEGEETLQIGGKPKVALLGYSMTATG